MEYNSGQLQELQKLKSELLQELFTLQKKLKGTSFLGSFALLTNTALCVQLAAPVV